jgi:hypothetical protein
MYGRVGSEVKDWRNGDERGTGEGELGKETRKRKDKESDRRKDSRLIIVYPLIRVVPRERESLFRRFAGIIDAPLAAEMDVSMCKGSMSGRDAMPEIATIW